MRKIIEGKLYDTETAKVIGDYEHSFSGQFDYFYECLYKKRTGEYFLYYEGGAGSKYSCYIGSGTTSGASGIEPLSYSLAKDFVEKKLSVSVYENEFGLPEETQSGNITLSVSVSPEASFLARKMANVKKISLSKFVESAIMQYYKSEYLDYDPEK